MKCINLQATQAMSSFQITYFIDARLAPASLDYSCLLVVTFFTVKLSHKYLFTRSIFAGERSFAQNSRELFQNILHHEKNASNCIETFLDIQLNYHNLNIQENQKVVRIIKYSIHEKLAQNNSGLFFAKIANVLRSLAIFTEELLCGCLTGF